VKLGGEDGGSEGPGAGGAGGPDGRLAEDPECARPSDGRGDPVRVVSLLCSGDAGRPEAQEPDGSQAAQEGC
jgi:hypothetical protein